MRLLVSVRRFTEGDSELRRLRSLVYDKEKGMRPRRKELSPDNHLGHVAVKHKKLQALPRNFGKSCPTQSVLPAPW